MENFGVIRMVSKKFLGTNTLSGKEYGLKLMIKFKSGEDLVKDHLN